MIALLWFGGLIQLTRQCKQSVCEIQAAEGGELRAWGMGHGAWDMGRKVNDVEFRASFFENNHNCTKLQVTLMTAEGPMTRGSAMAAKPNDAHQHKICENLFNLRKSVCHQQT